MRTITCDLCGVTNGLVRRYSLLDQITRRGEGSIDLCRDDWQRVAEPRKQPKRGVRHK